MDRADAQHAVLAAEEWRRQALLASDTLRQAYLGM